MLLFETAFLVCICLLNVAAASEESADDAFERAFESNGTSGLVLSLPDLDVPQSDFFSISDRISALRNVFETVLSLERDLVWNPIVPSRMSRGFFLVKLLSNVLRIMPFRDFAEQVRDGITSRASCLTCNILANVFTSRLFSTDIIAFATRAVCVVFRLQTPRVCYGLINSFRNVLDYVRLNTRLQPEDMCGVFLGASCATRSSDKLNWTIDIPAKEELAPIDWKNLLDQVMPENAEVAASDFKVVQITDIHFDPYFSPGTRTDCGEPVCCRNVNGPARTLASMAGIWGDYTDCDTPYFTVDSALKRVTSEHPDATYWMMTGDLPPHDIWEYNRNETLAHIRFMTWMVKEHSKGAQVYPVLGNHEAVPINSFAPHDIEDKDHSPSWLYEYAADQWSDWLPESALRTLRQSGNYMVRVKPGFRIVSVNSNYCARLNPWTLYDSVDPGGQLKWLTAELLAAERKGDKVHVIGHVPPDHRECTQAWLFNYIRIVERFSETITAQFYGHTHRDEFRVIYALDDEDGQGKEPRNARRPVGYQFIGPSITSYSQTNPGYRVYSVDDKSFQVVDYDTYFFNLTETNEANYMPKWMLEYRASDSYQMGTASGESFDQLLRTLENDTFAFEQYYRRYYVKSEVDTAKFWDLTRRELILQDHRVENPFSKGPSNLIPV